VGGSGKAAYRPDMATTFVPRILIVALAASAFSALPVAAEEAEAAYLPSRCRTGRVVCLDKSTRTLRWVVNGAVRLSMPARFGSTWTPTRNGLFRIYWKDIDHVSSLYGSPMRFSMFFSGGQAIHYSPDFARYGYSRASHGCVNTRDWSKTRTLYNATRVGDLVYVYWS
jgi:hypothetical protein